MNAYTRLLGGDPDVGQIEIVGDAAMPVSEADKGVVTYVQRGYKVADRSYMGIGNGQTVAAAGGPDSTFTRAVVEPFKPLKMIVPSWAAGLVLVSATIGTTQLIDGDPVPMEAFSEVSNAGDFSWPTVEMSQSITMIVRNRNAFAIDLDIGFFGIRLRK